MYGEGIDQFVAQEAAAKRRQRLEGTPGDLVRGDMFGESFALARTMIGADLDDHVAEPGVKLRSVTLETVKQIERQMALAGTLLHQGKVACAEELPELFELASD